jgi:hypothetical protein
MDSPLRKRKVKKEEWKKQRPVISKATVKRICQCEYADNSTCWWLERWIDELVRTNNYPPQLRSDDFYSLLGHYFSGETAMKILMQVREDYIKIYPLTTHENMDWLPPILEQDENSGY